MSTGVLIVGHGSRDAASNAEFEAFVGEYRTARRSLHVAHAYVELARPPITSALHELARRADHVIVMPLFLFMAGHVKNDLPIAIHRARRDFTSVVFMPARPLGVHQVLVQIAFERARAALDVSNGPRKTALIVVGRGSSDPDANAEFCKLVRLLAEGRNFTWVLPSFIGITTPVFEDVIDLVARARPDRIVVLPYFLFAGRLIEKLGSQVDAFRSRHPWIRVELAGHLGGDERLFDVIDERAEEAMSGARPLPCDNCQYRVPVSAVENRVGGLEALLWSLRHGFTHNQAMPHVHAHRPLKKHVLVCTNADCADRGSIALVGTLRRLIKEAGHERDIRVTRTLCMGRCGEGPTVAVYPDGIWYRGVRQSDAAELVEKHLLDDQLVGRLVDSIMQ